MTASPGFLDAGSSEQLFEVLERALVRYQSGKGKRIEDAFLLVFGLTHLREWIAPGFKGGEPKDNAERFSAALFSFETYDLLRRFANQGKHQGESGGWRITQNIEYGTVDDAPDFDAMLDFDQGPPTEYWIGGHKAGEIFDAVVEFYRVHWFSRPLVFRFA